ncbi:MAG: LysM peptidoglycan-binding domain-containing protein [Akkermansiaceae bacterium]|nr:LysM peptidoglycan-binding domain-containing protein [Akkermansiaceae bacterium]
MTPLRIIAPSLLAVALVSCASNPNTTTAVAAPTSTSVADSANPVYDTPAAYQEAGSSTASTPTIDPTAVDPTTSPSTPPSTTGAAPSNGAAIIHTVVAGDTLSGISKKYKVPSASIKQANHITKDIVILGHKMVIPPVH